MKAVSLSLQTVVIMILILVTLLGVAFFFRSNFTTVGGRVAELLPGYGDGTDLNSSHWGCENNWACVYISGAQAGQLGSSGLGTYEDCAEDATCKVCLEADPPTCRCECRK